MQSSFPRPTHTGPLISSLAVVHNSHSTNSKKGKLENRSLVMSFPSLNTITLRKEFRAGAVNTVQSYCSFDAHGTQAPTCAVPFAGLANLIPVSALVTLPSRKPRVQILCSWFPFSALLLLQRTSFIFQVGTPRNQHIYSIPPSNVSCTRTETRLSCRDHPSVPDSETSTWHFQ